VCASALMQTSEPPTRTDPDGNGSFGCNEPSGGLSSDQRGLESLSALGRSAGLTSTLFGAAMGSIVATRRAHDGDIVFLVEASVSLRGSEREGTSEGT